MPQWLKGGTKGATSYQAHLQGQQKISSVAAGTRIRIRAAGVKAGEGMALRGKMTGAI
jgi:hypothetical protein